MPEGLPTEILPGAVASIRMKLYASESSIGEEFLGDVLLFLDKESPEVMLSVRGTVVRE